MAISTPIYKIAKDLGIDSKRVLLACKTLGINAKGSTKRLNKEEISRIINHFETGKNVSDEVVNIINTNKRDEMETLKNKTKNKNKKINYFSNRLIG
tara:strand:+ start:26404 stop:26694 length:291 start_codon:yes stop_codon:yes gene_type:complete